MDIEGGEFEIFKNSAHFGKFKNIGMEFHADPKPLEEKLTKEGFRVETEYISPDSGYLYAWRQS